ncbi:hypothetical protein SDC9_85567 [bioreactor metagenome]|uniref:Uncharacterized protein n=1 Tax=bioreactor metagenome TaxID=1076179 RepID=A0A644ZDJ0_9ZZZZ
MPQGLLYTTYGPAEKPIKAGKTSPIIGSACLVELNEGEGAGTLAPQLCGQGVGRIPKHSRRLMHALFQILGDRVGIVVDSGNRRTADIGERRYAITGYSHPAPPFFVDKALSQV